MAASADWLRRPLDLARAEISEAVRQLSQPPEGGLRVDFREPAGDPGILGPDAVAWRVYANPVTLFIGGITAVLLELAEPRVRTGVWEHTDFRRDPVGRMRRTGFAAMVTVYGPLAEVEKLTARVRRMHDGVEGMTPEGVAYRASDPELLHWVHATAAYSFLRAFQRYADPMLTPAELDRFYEESAAGAAYYGVTDPPRSVAEVRAAFQRMRPALRHHPIVDEFLALVRGAPIVALPARPLQWLLIEASIDLLPTWARQTLHLEGGQVARVAARPLVSAIARAASALVTEGIPQDACRRVGVAASNP